MKTKDRYRPCASRPQVASAGRATHQTGHASKDTNAPAVEEQSRQPTGSSVSELHSSTAGEKRSMKKRAGRANWCSRSERRARPQSQMSTKYNPRDEDERILFIPRYASLPSFSPPWILELMMTLGVGDAPHCCCCSGSDHKHSTSEDSILPCLAPPDPADGDI